ncbi:MAG: hypothetical protein LBH19_13780, partial [Dysgonamonadaceae bacterium]|nr:hypothetical protein [Dysgonamonadaceae bacterium]
MAGLTRNSNAQGLVINYERWAGDSRVVHSIPFQQALQAPGKGAKANGKSRRRQQVRTENGGFLSQQVNKMLIPVNT